jgi:hypothetical protein
MKIKFPIKCVRCGHSHSSINEMWDFHRCWFGTIAWFCDNCQYGQDILGTENISLRKFLIENNTTYRKVIS